LPVLKGLNMEASTPQRRDQPAVEPSSMQIGAREYTPLHLESRTHVGTDEMCWHLGFAPQTARLWACKETYPEGLAPIRINGRLRWPVAGIRRALGVA